MAEVSRACSFYFPFLSELPAPPAPPSLLGGSEQLRTCIDLHLLCTGSGPLISSTLQP
jgi:hypothetical protein